MRHTSWLGLAVGICCSGLLAAAEAAPETPDAEPGERWERRVGEARDLKDGSVRYREEHLLRRGPDGEPQQRIVLYRCPDGSAFGRKMLDYGNDPLVPSFRMEDARWGYVEQLEPTPEGLKLSVRRPGGEERSGIIAVEDAALVADAGYDEFVRRRWNQLLTGEKVRLDFIVPSRLTYYGFGVQLKREEQVEDGALKVFSLGLAGFFRIFLPDIEVAYDAETRELRRFVGLTNIRNVEDKNVEARIKFPRGSEMVSAARAESAQSEALSGRCP